MKPLIGIISSGLGHVARGNESWAQSLAEGLQALNEEACLFGHGPLRTPAPYRRVTTLRRDHGLWSWWLSWGCRYAYEQSLFAWRLRPVLSRMGCDIAHTGDPQIAWFLRKHCVPENLSVIYKDGLLLGPTWNRNFQWVQVLAPYYLELGRAAGIDTTGWRVIPHFVDVTRFGSANAARVTKLRLPPRLPGCALRVLAVGALAEESNKRLDWIAREVSKIERAELLVAGQATPGDTAEFERRARPCLGARLHVLTNVPSGEMPAVFASADVFVHAALREPFGIVFLEAMASGLPIIGHTFEVTRWIIGDGGQTVNMEEPGALADHARSNEPKRGRASPDR